MQTELLADQIPAEYRREILLTNMINEAQLVNKPMRILFTYWQVYIEPDIRDNCPLCFEKVLLAFRAMQNRMIELEKQSELLKEV